MKAESVSAISEAFSRHIGRYRTNFPKKVHESITAPRSEEFRGETVTVGIAGFNRVHNLGPKDVATQFGISERTARRMMNDGHLSAIRIGAKLWRTDQASMDEYVKEGQYTRYRRELRIVELPAIGAGDLAKLKG